MQPLPIVRSPNLRAPERRCECCHHADVIPRRTGYSIGCLDPRAHYGQAGIGKACCGFEREPGTDDDLERLPPLADY